MGKKTQKMNKPKPTKAWKDDLGTQVTEDSLWELTKDYTSYLNHNHGLTISTDPLNLSGLNYKRDSGIAVPHALGISTEVKERNVKEKNPSAISLIPNISSLRNNVSNKLYEYNYFTYILNASLFKNVQYQKDSNLAKFAEKFILNRSFVSFNDIYDTTTDKNKPTKQALLDIYDRAQRSGYKSLFLYGPNGSGKTLYVHALAAELGAVLGQLDNLQHIKIQYFVKEFARIITEYINRPIIVYIKNVDSLSKNALGEILFLHDKFNTFKKNALFICSSPFPLQNLPQQLKFKYIQLINSANQTNKYNLFRFLTNKFGIKISMSDSDLNDLRYYQRKSERAHLFYGSSNCIIEILNGEFIKTNIFLLILLFYLYV